MPGGPAPKAHQWLQAHANYAGDDCLPWPFALTGRGYPSVKFRQKQRGAHRVMCELAHGPAPAGMEAAHSCGNKWCVNPKHVRWATKVENAADTILHGTRVYGAAHYAAKLTPAQILDIRAARARKVFATALARQYGVSSSAIYAIEQGKTWKQAA